MPLWLIYGNPYRADGGEHRLFLPILLAGGSRRAVGSPGREFALVVSGVGLLCLAHCWRAGDLGGIIEFRKGNSLWKHHLASALWTFTCYAIVIALMSNGYLLTA